MRWTYEFKVGLFSITAILVIAYMFFVLTPDIFTSRNEERYYTVIEDAGGIVNKTQVKTSGVVVGKVISVALEGTQSRINFAVDSSVKLPRGTEVMIREKGLLGDVFLEVVRSEDKGDYLKAGDFIPPAKNQISISKLITIANSIGTDIKKITGNMADVLGGEEGKKNIGSIVTDVRDVAGMLKAILSENKNGFRNIIANLEQTTHSLNGVVSNKKEDLSDIIGNFKEVSEGLKEVLKTDNRNKLDRILTALEGATTKINSGQGSIGRLINDEKMADEFEGAVKDLRSMLSPAKKMQIAVDFHGEYKGQSRSQAYFNIMLKPRPDKYYLLGVTDTFESQRDTFIEKLPPRSGETSPDALSSSRYHRSTVERPSIRFNVQYAQRWGFGQFRFGLFESTGGLAGDFFLLEDTIQLTFEAYDFRKADQRNFARLKTYASILFFNHLYAMFGADDLTRRDPNTGKKQSPYLFMGAGFRFTDEDLKGLFGLAASRL